MTMMRIRLELARDHDFPSGSSDRGYEFAAPLDGSGHIDKEQWRRDKAACRVKRFWPGEYVSIEEHDDKLRTFKVMSVRELAA